MASTSSIVIDGATINGNTLTICNTYVAVSNALKSLKDTGHNAMWLPIVGTNGDGNRVVQAILLHRTSSVHVTLVEDGDFAIGLLDELSDASEKFFEKFGLDSLEE